MALRTLLAAFALIATGLVATPATAHPADRTPSVDAASVLARGHACTRTSSGSCIRGGQFCPQSKYGKSGWDAKGRRYVCKGSRSHPHWMKP